ncbi:MAG: anthranilate phosphoribosyltransferase [Elusimicrobiota bacterium]
MIKEIITKLIDKKDLTRQEAYDVMQEIMQGQATPSQIAGFLVALRNKGETVKEIAGFALAMRDAAQSLHLHSDQLVDCCGTGGDGKGGLNLSTAVSFVAAGAGLIVAKHGNRAVSSHSGSGDVLEMMGVRIDPPPAVIEQEIDQAGMGFMFAPLFHPAMKHAMPSRKELGIRTVFNILGPLTNPARVRVQMIGVYDPRLTKVMASVMAEMGHRAGLVVHSNGWDEITLEGKTIISQMVKGKVKTFTWTHRDFGLPKISSKHLIGGDARKSADFILELLSGKETPARSVVVANAAALLFIADKGYKKGTLTLKEAVIQANQAIDTGKALEKFKLLAEISHNLE